MRLHWSVGLCSICSCTVAGKEEGVEYGNLVLAEPGLVALHIGCEHAPGDIRRRGELTRTMRHIMYMVAEEVAIMRP